ncbi:hypothetical protein [Saccharolobus sp.]|uniref:rolling circle replication-associated protein n=1 Tax=Saccharolobus TaxID=2100760 RepID=UPI00386A9DCF
MSSFFPSSSVDSFIISRLKKENSVSLVIMAKEYAKERNIKLESARKVLERHLKNLIQQGIVERIDTYPVTYKLKRLPTQFLSSCNKNTVPFTGIAKKRNTKQKRLTRKVLQRYLKALIQGEGLLVKPSHLIYNKNFRLNDPFDLSNNNPNSADLGKSADLEEKIQELRKAGLRVIKMNRVNRFRQRALLFCQYKTSIYPDIRESIASQFSDNKKEWNNSIMVFESDNEEFMKMPVRTRFNDKERAYEIYMKGSRIIDNAFKMYKDAVFLTITTPPIFPLVIPIMDNDKVLAVISLQESIIKELLKRLKQWVRDKWKGRKLAFTVHYEYHQDYRLHAHVLIYGIPYIIDWKKKMGNNKEDPFTYYVKKFNIPLSSGLEERLREGKLRVDDKTYLSKLILTGYLDKVLVEDILPKFESVLKEVLKESLLSTYLGYTKKVGIQGTELVEDLDDKDKAIQKMGLLKNIVDTYLRYKEDVGIQGPINEVHRVRENKWVGPPPKDAVTEYSSGAAYRKVMSPKKYVLKYVLKMVYAIAQGTPIDPKESAKAYGYWLFGKRYYSYSPSLLPKELSKEDMKVPYWHFVGIFDILDLPDYIYNKLYLQ